VQSLHAAPARPGRRSPAWFAAGAAAVPALAVAVLLGADGSPRASAAFTPPGRVAYVAVDGDSSRIWAADPGSGRGVALTGGHVSDASPSWSPDGRWVAFDRAGDRGGVFAVPASGGGAAVRIASAGACIDPAWSPDGRAIACADTRRGRAGLVLVALPGADRRRLTMSGVGDRSPAWSPDGRRIAFTRLSRSGWDLWVLRLADRSLRRITAAGTRAGSPAWSPDGRLIAYVDGTRLSVLDPAGGPSRSLVDGQAFGPSWAPNGRYIAFWTSDTGRAQLRAVEVETGVVRPLAMPSRNAHNVLSPSWAPVGAHGGPWAADRGDPVAAWLAARSAAGG
jgi:TolB protein